jgi:hypothetical protein
MFGAVLGPWLGCRRRLTPSPWMLKLLGLRDARVAGAVPVFLAHAAGRWASALGQHTYFGLLLQRRTQIAGVRQFSSPLLAPLLYQGLCAGRSKTISDAVLDSAVLQGWKDRIHTRDRRVPATHSSLDAAEMRCKGGRRGERARSSGLHRQTAGGRRVMAWECEVNRRLRSSGDPRTDDSQELPLGDALSCIDNQPSTSH